MKTNSSFVRLLMLSFLSGARPCLAFYASNVPFSSDFEGSWTHKYTVSDDSQSPPSSMGSILSLKQLNFGDSSFIVSGSQDKAIRIHKITNSSNCTDQFQFILETTLTIKAHSGPVFSIDVLDVSETTKILVSGAYERECRVWKLYKEGEEIKVIFLEILNGHTGWVKDVLLLKEPNAQGLLSIGCNFIKVWEPQPNFKHLGDVKVHGDILTLAAGGGHLFAGKVDGTIQAWDISGTEPLRQLLSCTPATTPAHEGRVTGLCFHDGHIYSIGYDGCVRCWKHVYQGTAMKLLAERRVGVLPEDWLLSLHLSTFENNIICGSRKGSIHVLSLFNLAKIDEIQTASSSSVNSITSVTIGHGTGLLIAGTKGGVIEMFVK